MFGNVAHEFIPAEVFGPSENCFTIPYDAEIRLRDELDKIYTLTTPNELDYEDLVAGLGRFVKMDDKGEYFTNLRMLKNAPNLSFLTAGGVVLTADGIGLTYQT